MGRSRILIVEDEAIVGLALRRKLESWGYESLGPERTGSAAIESFDRDSPDLALLDIYLADSVDCIEVARHLRETSAVPFIFLTASQDPETRARAMSERPSDIIPKPYDESSLRAAIAAALPAGGNASLAIDPAS